MDAQTKLYEAKCSAICRALKRKPPLCSLKAQIKLLKADVAFHEEHLKVFATEKVALESLVEARDAQIALLKLRVPSKR